mmetsp:Transcript_23630/g.32414  ORF Transcript_23630/g.32414 Transcript_23630/m.32414 type:complete len:1528 (-) Transcript_23630:123-4706(-)
MKRLFKVGAERHDIGKVTFSWHPEGNFLATAGKNGIIHITDRHGDIVDEIPMSTSAPVTCLEWDKDGEYLAILQDGNGVVPLWNLSSKRVVPLETNLKDPTFLAWSKTGPQLAIGTAKGSLLIYNKVRRQKIPIVGKHSKRISCGAWSQGGNKLVLGSDDRTLTISNENGDTLLHTELKHIPLQSLFTNNKSSAQFSSSSSDDNTVSANLNGKSLLLYNIVDEKEDPMELTFAPKENGVGCKYGEIISHHWFEEGSLLVGFSNGYLLSVSTGAKDLGEEKNMARFHPSALYTFAYNPHSKRAATAGDDGVRVIDTRDFRESKKDFIPAEEVEDGRVTALCWSPDGQILTVGTAAGNVYNFLAKMSVLSASNKVNVCYLSSLRELSVVDCGRRTKPIDITLKLEPAIIAVGAKHVAAGMNNRVYYHRITPNGAGQAPINEQEYVGIVKEVQLNHAFSVILTDSKAMIHPIEPSPTSQSQTKTFPSREEGSMSKITCVALTDEFLFYGTEAGTVEVFFLGEWVLLAGVELRLDPPSAIKKLYPNASGSRVVVVDAANRSFLFNPVTGGGLNQSITQFDSSPQNIINVMWDMIEKNVIMFFDGKFIHSYVYTNTSIKGPLLIKLGPITVSSEGEVSLTADKSEVVPGNYPILCIAGSITCQTVAGTLTNIPHPYFDKLLPSGGVRKGGDSDSPVASQISQKKDKKLLGDRFCQSLVLLKLETAWEVALELNRRQFWLALSGKAMEMMNVELACRVYRQLGDAGMVMALQDCVYVEDKNLLAGKISMLFGDYNRAQDLYLASSRPSAALDMRRDLLQWDQALKLAQVLNVNQIPEICLQYGQQLEFREEIERALKMFEAALNTQDSEGNFVCPESLVSAANIGVARCNLRLGNIRQGIRLANELDDQQLFIDSGDILEQQKQYSEAAAMYIKGLQYEKAARIYIKNLIKNDKSRITEVAAIMSKVDNDNLNSNFAKACVGAGRYEDAVKAYERAKDMDKVVELKLRHLDQAQQAFDLVRQSASAQGAQFVADYCQETNDYRGAIEFLLIANKSDEAFKLAQSQSIVDVYTSILGENIASEDAMKVASYYEKISNFGLAGRFYSLCGQYSRALKLFIQCGDKEIDAAIEVVGRSQNENLTHQLIDFLVGEKDGVPKDQNYIYRLYLALKKYEDAAKTALIIARSEQDAGNYALAHSIVVETVREFENAGINVSLQLRQTFVLLHSYIIVKALVRRGDHNGAARLLLRVVQNVSKFPSHVVQILTSTVIECQRAGLKASSYEYAAMLMRPEYRPSIDANLKRKIEAIVRRRYAQGEEAAEEVSTCPISGQLIPEYQLESPSTRDALPMCIITGKHMLLDDWCFCPVSKCPALYSEYVRYIESEIKATTAAASSNSVGDGDVPIAPSAPSIANISSKLSATDPIHGKSVSISDLKLCPPDEAMKYIQRYNNVVEKKAGSAGNNGEDGVQNGVNNQDGEDLDGTKVKKKDGNGQGVDAGEVGVEKSAPQSNKLKLDRAQKTKEKMKRSNAESNKN